MKISVDSASNIPKTIIWEFSGSSTLVSRVGNLCYWDSTHHISRYEYWLSSVLLIDSESKLQRFLQAVMLNESADDVKQMIFLWHELFKLHLPQIMFTYENSAMCASISSLPYSEHIFHLLCFFHLIDQNFKSKVRACLSSEAEGSVWPLFRKDIVLCRNATTEQDF